MGFNFRKSIKIGPARINLSKSGIGYSVGVKGARVTKTAKGKTRTTLSIPGTGISYSKTKGKEKSGTNRTNTDANKSKRAATSTTVQDNQPSTIKKSWPMAIVMAIIALAVVLAASFIVLLIVLLVFSLAGVTTFNGTFAKITLTYVPIALGAVSAVIAFRHTIPEKAQPDDLETANPKNCADNS